MQLEDIKPGQSLEGIAPASLAHVVAVAAYGPDFLAVVYRGDDGNLREILLGRADEPFIHVPSRHRPWAFDADGREFLRAAMARLSPPSDGTLAFTADSARILQRGAFLLDPAHRGLGPSMLLVVAHDIFPAEARGAMRGVLCLRVDPMGHVSVVLEPPFPRLCPVDPALRPLLNDVLRPFLANHRLRALALAFAATLIASNAATAGAAPGAHVSPPVLLGGSIVIPEGLLRWLSRDDAVGREVIAPQILSQDEE
ncbi:MAG: hypothetical protein WCR07_02260 [Verrucomicrobiota bacterium]|jgi:hypothetical protein